MELILATISTCDFCRVWYASAPENDSSSEDVFVVRSHYLKQKHNLINAVNRGGAVCPGTFSGLRRNEHAAAAAAPAACTQGRHIWASLVRVGIHSPPPPPAPHTHIPRHPTHTYTAGYRARQQGVQRLTHPGGQLSAPSLQVHGA